MKKMFWPALAIAAASLVGAGGASAQLKIGVAGPLTGPNAAFGAQLKNGAEQAAADINAKGGINGQKIELVFGDDVSDPKQGVSVANKFVGDKVQYVIGHFNSGVTNPASDVYAEHGIFMITPSATNPTITNARPMERIPHLRRRRQPGKHRSKVYRREVQGKERRDRSRQDDLWKGVG